MKLAAPRPTLLRILLLPPFMGLSAIIIAAVLFLYPRMLDQAVDREREALFQIGVAEALDLTHRADATNTLDFDRLDRIAFRASLDHVFLLDEHRRAIFANDVLLQGKDLAALPPLPDPIRKALQSDICDGVPIADTATQTVSGCWPVTLGRRPDQIAGQVRGRLVLVRSMTEAISGTQSRLLEEGLQGLGLGTVALSLLLLLSVRLIVQPVARLTAGLAAMQRGDLRSVAVEGIEEIRDFAAVLDRTVASLREREREVAAILDTAVDGIITIRGDGTIIQANTAAVKMFGYAAEEMLGRSINMLMTSGDAARHGGYIGSYVETGHARVIGRGREVVGQRKDGSTLLLWLSVGRLETPQGLNFTATLRDVTADRMAEFDLHREAFRDHQLDIFNRRSWDGEVRRLFVDGQSVIDFWVLSVSVKNLDDLIVTFGPGIEAPVLAAVHGHLRSMLPQAELAARLSRSRLGFGVPTDDGRPPEDIEERLTAAFRSGLHLQGIDVYPDLQFVVMPEAQRFASGDELLQALEACASWASETAERRTTPVFVYDEKVSATIRARTEAAADLPAAMAAGQLFPVYQPQIDLRTGAVCGVETLVRWRKPDGTFISPGLFIPIAERIGLVSDVDRMVTRLGLEQLAAGRLGLPADAVLSVNASAKEIGEPGWVERLVGQIVGAGIAPGCVEIEVTETALLEDLDHMAGVLADLRALGVKVGIDDFGVGYASLSYLTRLPADVIKIDQSFIRPLSAEDRARRVVASMIGLCHDLGMKVVAEGVEDADTAAILAEAGCDIGQGWHFGRPMDCDALNRFIAERSAVKATM